MRYLTLSLGKRDLEQIVEAAMRHNLITASTVDGLLKARALIDTELAELGCLENVS